MALTDSILNYRRYLKRKNFSPHTVKNYLHSVKEFVLWLDVPLEEVGSRKISQYIDFLLRRRLSAKTINCHLERLRQFYDYLFQEEGVAGTNPVKKDHALRMSRPLPKSLKDEDLRALFRVIKNRRDRAMFMLMLRCGLRVEEVAKLSFDVIELRGRTVVILDPKWGKDRVVYLSDDALKALLDYLEVRPASTATRVFLVEKGTYRGNPLSIRGIQKRMEYYARRAGLSVSCHHLRHTMATHMLNAEAELTTVQDLLGHTWITTTQRYCRLSNHKVRSDYFKAVAVVVQKTTTEPFKP
jgi:site-specific recombinase XerD